MKQPLTRALPMDHAGVSAPIPQLYDLWLDYTDKNVGSNLPLLFKLHKICRLGVKATNSKTKAKAPHPPIRSRPRKVFTVHYITLIIAALSKSLDDDASMCRK